MGVIAEASYENVGEITFDHVRRRSSVIVRVYGEQGMPVLGVAARRGSARPKCYDELEPDPVGIPRLCRPGGFSDTTKYIKITAGFNFSDVLTVMVASAFPPAIAPRHFRPDFSSKACCPRCRLARLTFPGSPRTWLPPN
jgi:hypothetical protein